jgi:hypothetical protein
MEGLDETERTRLEAAFLADPYLEDELAAMVEELPPELRGEFVWRVAARLVELSASAEGPLLPALRDVIVTSLREGRGSGPHAQPDEERTSS